LFLLLLLNLCASLVASSSFDSLRLCALCAKPVFLFFFFFFFFFFFVVVVYRSSPSRRR